jgi:hypothetical protein
LFDKASGGDAMNSAFTDLISVLDAIGTISGWTAFAAITAAGTVAMAMLQVVKDLTPIRRMYQRWWLERWISQRVAEYAGARRHSNVNQRVLPAVSAPRAETLMLELSTGGEEDAFYELAIEQMVAQINAAAQITLDYPKTYCDLLVVLSEGADLGDVAAVIAQSPEGSRTRRKEPSAKYLEARARVSHRVQRNLDAVQIALGNRWQFFLQLTAMILSVLLIEIAVVTVTGFKSGPMAWAVLLGILGGYLAPVARDVVAALQTLRK